MQVERKTLKKSAWTFLAVVDRKKFAGKENKNDVRLFQVRAAGGAWSFRAVNY